MQQTLRKIETSSLGATKRAFPVLHKTPLLNPSGHARHTAKPRAINSNANTRNSLNYFPILQPILAESNEIRRNVTVIKEAVDQIDQIISKLPPLRSSQSVMHIRART
jgi:hypothetical protein